jgi:hypothetical protein
MARSAWPAASRTGTNAQSDQSRDSTGTALACLALPISLTMFLSFHQVLLARRIATLDGSRARLRSSSDSEAHCACVKCCRLGKVTRKQLRAF